MAHCFKEHIQPQSSHEIGVHMHRNTWPTVEKEKKYILELKKKIRYHHVHKRSNHHQKLNSRLRRIDSCMQGQRPGNPKFPENNKPANPPGLQNTLPKQGPRHSP